ncbi:hypothetical protein LX69_02660 [Breznakibacter xylanolyticus]|uniref:Uncharacterized protein n=1 Tax=Breznakibacter xylanolyticus TaxID=990 RepID=A0A2W7N969_9BACT|nr:hypothetical protein LX69_02660 [Breznakibacter xylanolyticus]
MISVKMTILLCSSRCLLVFTLRNNYCTQNLREDSMIHRILESHLMQKNKEVFTRICIKRH